MPRLVVGALVDQGRLARITLPDGAEVLRSTAAGSLAIKFSSNLTSAQTIYLSRAAVKKHRCSRINITIRQTHRSPVYPAVLTRLDSRILRSASRAGRR